MEVCLPPGANLQWSPLARVQPLHIQTHRTDHERGVVTISSLFPRMTGL